VVSWLEFGDDDILAAAVPYPNTDVKIEDCETFGRGSNTAVDIVFNTNTGLTWHFNVTEPSSHTSDTFDFVSVLAHELGHGLGIAHSVHTNSIMHGYPYGGYVDRDDPVRSMSPGDKAAAVYQHTVTTLPTGTLDRPLVLSASTDTFTLSGNLTIPSSQYLQLGSGKHIAVSQDVGILSQGMVDLNCVTITKSGANNWDALTLSGSGVAGSSITGSTITRSVNGVRLINADNVSITSSVIKNHQNNGLYVYGSGGIQITSTDFSMNGAAGILGDVSAVYFHPLNSFNENAGSGIVADGVSWMTFGTVDEEAKVTAMANTVNGVHALAYSYVELGGPAGGTTYGGWNTIRSNNSFNARAQNNSYIESQYTYWGNPGQIANKISVDGTSTVDYSNWLSYPAFKALPEVEVLNNPDQRVPAIWKLRQQIARGEFNEAWWLAHHDEEMRQAARVVLLGDALQSADYVRTIALAGSVIENSKSVHEKELAYRALFLAELMSGDYRSAASYLSFLPEQGPGNNRHHLAALLPAELDYFERESVEVGRYNEVSIGNYPNPFNPTTVIGYQLSVSSEVKLSVFDIIGREVAVLVSGEMPAGVHQANFDGRNLASGLYMYRLQAGNQILTGKMMLVK
jgi:hypothetical protein